MSLKKRFISATLNMVSLLPFFLLYRIADLTFLILYYLLGYRRPVVDSNLRNAFPEKTDKERAHIRRDFYRFLADLLVEGIKMQRLTEKQIHKRLHLVNPEEVLQYYAQGQSVILVTGHYANWEWGIHALSLMSKHPALIIYKPLHNAIFEDQFNKMRTRFGAIMVPTKKTLRTILAYRAQPHASVFLADQTPTTEESDLFIPFLNQPTLVYRGIEKIAIKTGYPIVFCHIDRQKRGFYTCRFTTLVDEPKTYKENKITYIYNRFLEQIIQDKPELWLWSHKRWKHTKTHESS